ncbi:DegT/DnrJ/EryC1/StrS family aminotransferase [Halococcoides cellulosivorans]|uniref:DegT/DnrJ/EryC1/StrS aminotransferase family protein n=1 Tax=Halococcoides cellulosivorans TaxID=1679096 RepID=A0A2R4X3E5_9EURY|nr:DegT/DnrJ/EryC1/StrS family aminotransferase [Halococcoides cellulosivorans]AWB28314.1 hypothetical protein HARCEL1_11655 [Halococcoides cellulosivorans]
MTDSSRRDGRRARRWRLLAPAVTPITTGDLAAGIKGHAKRSGRAAFRRAIVDALDAAHAATYTSIRRALAASLIALADDREGDRVLIPAFCSPDFPAAIRGVGLGVDRYDVDPATLAADPAAVEGAIGPETLAVVAVNVLGYSSPMARLAAIASRADSALVEALGYALGSRLDGQPLGTFGDCAVLNFQQGKPIPVGGGMVLSQSGGPQVADAGRPAITANVGVLAGYAALSHPRPYYAYTRVRDGLARLGHSIDRPTTHPEGETDVAYDPPFATVSNFQGAIGRRVFDRLDRYQRHRQRVARQYDASFAELSGVQTIEPIDGLERHQHVRYPLLVASSDCRERLLAALADAGVQATTMYDYPAIDPDQFPGAARLQREILTLPTHPYVDQRDVASIVGTVRRVVTATT